MNIGLSTSVIQRGKSGVAQYVFALVAALSRHAVRHDLTLFVLKDDVPLFDFARESAKIIPVSERFRPPLKDILWHQTILPSLARAHRLDVLHVPSYRRMLWPRPCALVTTIHDLAPFHVVGKYDWKRMFYGRVVARWLAHRQDKIIAVSQNTATDILGFFKLPAENVSVIHNGLDHAHFFPDLTEAAKQFVTQRFDLREPFFLYVARLEHPAKNHVRLIEAFNRFKAETKSQWRLVLGGSDWHGAQTIHAAIGNRRSAATFVAWVLLKTTHCRCCIARHRCSFIHRCLKASAFRRWRRWRADVPCFVRLVERWEKSWAMRRQQWNPKMRPLSKRSLLRSRPTRLCEQSCARPAWHERRASIGSRPRRRLWVFMERRWKTKRRLGACPLRRRRLKIENGRNDAREAG